MALGGAGVSEANGVPTGAGLLDASPIIESTCPNETSLGAEDAVTGITEARDNVGVVV